MSSIDWLVTWKLFHHEFFWIYLVLAVPIRLILAGILETTTWRKRIVYVVVSSLVLSFASTWFPIIPVIAGSLLLIGHPNGQSLVISAASVGVALGLQALVIDAAAFRLLLKTPVKPRLAALVAANLANAILALTLGLWWAIRHMPTFEAALNWR